MAGRPAKPIDLHIVSGNPSHLTKAEIEHRKKSEIHLGEQKLVCPVYVKSNKEAYKKWKEIKKLYTGFKFVSSADIGVIARYCMSFAQYIDLIERRDRIARIELTGEETAASWRWIKRSMRKWWHSYKWKTDYSCHRLQK